MINRPLLEAFLDVATKLTQHGHRKYPELHVDAHTFVGCCYESQLVGPSIYSVDDQTRRRGFTYTTDVRACTNGGLSIESRWRTCRIEISERNVEEGIKIAGPNGWLKIFPDKKAKEQLLEEIRR